ncbi:MAG: hypothetical protein HN431_10350 [Bacteroidetes bacterium]|jgi:hypothetical protein|nr:hypothetical protein [Bacteroidota bacterium]
MNLNSAFLKLSILFVLISIVSSGICLGQNTATTPRVTVSNDELTILYINLANPVSVSVDGYLAEQIYISSSEDCELKGGSGSYTIKPTYTRGQSIKFGINVHVISKDKDTVFIEKKIFLLRRIPYATPYFGSKAGGNIGRGELRIVSFISARMESFPFDLKHQVVSFSMLVQPNGGHSKSYDANSNFLTAEMKEALTGVKKGDKLIFMDIQVATLQDGVEITKPRKLDEIFLIVN